MKNQNQYHRYSEPVADAIFTLFVGLMVNLAFGIPYIQAAAIAWLFRYVANTALAFMNKTGRA